MSTMSDDLVSRQAAIDALNKEIIKRRLLDDVNDGMLDEFDTEDILRKLPSVQKERKQGRWIDMDDHVLCSLCDAAHYGVDKNYCPNCGARME